MNEFIIKENITFIVFSTEINNYGKNKNGFEMFNFTKDDIITPQQPRKYELLDDCFRGNLVGGIEWKAFTTLQNPTDDSYMLIEFTSWEHLHNPDAVFILPTELLQ